MSGLQAGLAGAPSPPGTPHDLGVGWVAWGSFVLEWKWLWEERREFPVSVVRPGRTGLPLLGCRLNRGGGGGARRAAPCRPPSAPPPRAAPEPPGRDSGGPWPLQPAQPSAGAGGRGQGCGRGGLPAVDRAGTQGQPGTSRLSSRGRCWLQASAALPAPSRGWRTGQPPSLTAGRGGRSAPPADPPSCWPL